MAVLLHQSKCILHLDKIKIINTVFLNFKKLIMTSHTKFEKIFEDLQTNPYFSKYADKISVLQQTNPEEFLQRIEEKERLVKHKKEHQSMQKQFEAIQVAKPKIDTGYKSKANKLNDIMKLDLIKNKSKEDIKKIWYEYHKQKDCISGILTKDQFMKMFERGKMYSTFLLPLPRDCGYEFIISQFYGAEIHMTPLLWYQVHKENSPECLTMMHYTEFMESKDIVLMRGEFDIQSINVREAQFLANELQIYYCSDNLQRLQLLKTFTDQPNNFKHMDLIKNLETISFDSGTSDSL